MKQPDPIADFIVAACVPRNASHASGTLDQAREILARHPAIASANLYVAAILGDDITVRDFIERDRESVNEKGGPHGWDALTYLCFSRFLRLDPDRSEGFVRAATALLDAGASANTGWFEPDHQPSPEWEPVLYGASGVAHHAGLTRLLLSRGANPNDNEAVYHTPETFDNTCLKLLVETGSVTAENLVLMLVRKHDWHDYEGAKWLLEHGASPNWTRERGWHPLPHALVRDNDLKMIRLLLDHGANPTVVTNGRTAIALAARRGRSDVLELLQQRGIPFGLQGADRLIAACALNQGMEDRTAVEEVLRDGGKLLAEFAGNDNSDGISRLLELGVPVDARFTEGDGYWGVARDSTALHVAAWRASHASVKLLVERGAPVNARDARDRTPLMLAVKACVDSYWTRRRKPDSIAVLLAAGASVDGIALPTGYDDADRLLTATRR